ncbi:MAG: MATE family efflux transporter [Clostridiales bacterium]|nr:MATE family efflux transporter [Clostridiales bacterium]
MNKDLTTGKPGRNLLLYTLPLLGSVLFTQLYNVADSLVAGKFIGESALAAVGNASEITLIYTAFAFGCNIGCSVVVSQLFGAGDRRKLKTAVSTSYISFGLLCALLTILGLLFSPTMLRLIKTPDSIFADSRAYILIYTLGMPFVFFYNIATGIFSALGDSRTPFIFLAASSSANIVVDILFVKAFHLGVPGVAWATVLCQSVSCILAVVVLSIRLRSMDSGEAKPELFSLEILKKILKVAIPSILQQAFTSVGNIIVQGIINGFGESIIAGATAALKLNAISTSCLSAAANGLSTYTAQNIGADKPERIKPGYRAGLLLGALTCVPLVAAYCCFGGSLVGLFIDNPSAEAIETGILFLRIVSPFYFVIMLKIMTDGVLRGAGAINFFMISTFADLFLRVILAAIMSNIFDSLGIWLSWPVGWTIGALLSLGFYFAGVWKRAKL